MTREEAKQLLPIIKSFSEGKEIEWNNYTRWLSIDTLNLYNLYAHPQDYRIKPSTTYRHFANAEECWNEMLKHQPIGWVRINNDRYYITSVANNDVYIDDTITNNLDVFDNYTFADGTPFGIKEESEG